MSTGDLVLGAVCGLTAVALAVLAVVAKTASVLDDSRWDARAEHAARTKGDVGLALFYDDPTDDEVDEDPAPTLREETIGEQMRWVSVGDHTVHANCRDARRDGGPVCGFCAPVLGGQAAGLPGGTT